MRRNIQAGFALIALVAIAPVHAGCGKGNSKDKHSFVECLCPLIAYEAQKEAEQLRTIAYVENTSACTGTPNGSLSCPFKDIPSAIASKRSIIYVIATRLTYTISSEIVLGPNQALIGSSRQLELNGKKMPPRTAEKPTLELTSPGAGISIGDKSRVSGFTIIGAGASLAIESQLSGTSQCTITDNDFQEIDGAISLQITAPPARSPGVTISGNTFSNITSGVSLAIANEGRVRCARNTFTDVQTGLIAQGTTSAYELRVRDNQFGGSVSLDTAIEITGGQEVSLIGNTISSYETGFSVQGSSFLGSKLIVTGNTLSDIVTGNEAGLYQTMTLSNNALECALTESGTCLALTFDAGEKATAERNTFAKGEFGLSASGIDPYVLSLNLNKFTGSAGTAIHVTGGKEITLTSNTVSSYKTGLSAEGSSLEGSKLIANQNTFTDIGSVNEAKTYQTMTFKHNSFRCSAASLGVCLSLTLGGREAATVQENIFENGIFGFFADWVVSSSAYDLVVKSNEFIKGSSAESSCAIAVNGGQKVTISGNKASSYSAGLLATGAVALTTSNFTVTDNVFDKISVGNNVTAYQTSTFTSNRFMCTPPVAAVGAACLALGFSGSGATSCIRENEFIGDSNSYGLFVNSSQTSPAVTPCVQLDGNTATANGLGGLAVGLSTNPHININSNWSSVNAFNTPRNFGANVGLVTSCSGCPVSKGKSEQQSKSSVRRLPSSLRIP